MKINILSPGRFHVLDLARELDRLGHDVRFYSYVSDKRAAGFGLNPKINRNCLPFLAPFLALRKFRLKNAKKYAFIAQDYITSLTMRKCDVVIAMSGVFCHTLEKAKKQGATIIVERGSKHILEQKRILEESSRPGTIVIPGYDIERELRDYETADYISVASSHVIDSFVKHHYSPEKLFLNPYGVDLTMFKPLPETKKEFDVIMVGNWCYQKGCDLIVRALSETNYKFLHVGPLGDLPFPDNNPRFVHIDPVQQSELINYLNKARIFVLPSRQDGFGMVLSQALACNLPIVGSPDCGAPELLKMVEDKEAINIIKAYTPEALLDAIEKTLEKSTTLNGQSYSGHAIENLTWSAYGKRYDKFLKSIRQN